VPSASLQSAPKRQRTRVMAEDMGTSLLEYFTELQISTHVAKLQKKDGVQGGCTLLGPRRLPV
jgi:hypothetical protein